MFLIHIFQGYEARTIQGEVMVNEGMAGVLIEKE
jgi:hypothetical protein